LYQWSFFWQGTCHESQRLSKISTTHVEVLLAFEALDNHYHYRINSHVFKMKHDCYKIFHKRNINYLNVEGLFHTWTYMNLKEKSIKGFFMVVHLDQYACQMPSICK
jgi:hypothetical protein